VRNPTAVLAASLTALATTLLLAAPPAAGHGDGEIVPPTVSPRAVAADAPMQSGNVRSVDQQPGQLGISGCFLTSAPLYVTSGLDSLRVFDVSRPRHPELVGRLSNALFENEAMNCAERRTADGVKRFALIGVDAVQASPDDPQHVNAGGNELVVVDVTDPTDPSVYSRTPASTSTHTVACVEQRNCDYAYTAGQRVQRPGPPEHEEAGRGRRGSREAGTAGLHLADRRAQVELRRRPGRHPHRLRRGVDVGRGPPAAPRAAHHHRQGRAG